MISPAPLYLIDKILPTQEVHLLAGTSDAGKTRWLFHFLTEWEKGIPILGHASTPVPWVYVAADRTERTAHRTLQDMGYDPDRIPLIPAFGRQHKNKRQVIEEAAKRGAQLIVIEGFQKFVDPPGMAHHVTAFLEELSGYTDPSKDFPQGLTIIGVVESPKLKPNERYQDARQRVSGVSAWGYYSSTVFLIERKNPQDANDPRRTLFVCPKQGKRMEVDGGFEKNGHLVFDVESIENKLLAQGPPAKSFVSPHAPSKVVELRK